jgi:hypothetical protein
MRKLLALWIALAFVFALTASAVDTGKSTTVNGWVSDSQCGVKGGNATHEACTKKCLAGGAKMVVVTDKDQDVLIVDNPDALKGHEGHHVSLTGTIANGSIHVSAVKMI